MIKIGTRGSLLALKQVELVEVALSRCGNSCESFKRVIVTTSGDKLSKAGKLRLEDKRQWMEELEDSLLNGNINFAVHSAKDVPVDISDDTELIPVTKRGNPRDVFISRESLCSDRSASLEALVAGAVVGTSSRRRAAQLRVYRRELEIVPIRGNINTRLEKLLSNSAVDGGKVFSGIVLAAVGLERLGVMPAGAEYLPFSLSLPAVNQGIIVVQCRKDCPDMISRLRQLCEPDTEIAYRSERKVIEILGADCSSSVGVYALVDGGEVILSARVLSEDGDMVIEEKIKGKVQKAELLAGRLADILLGRGAEEILCTQRAKSWGDICK